MKFLIPLFSCCLISSSFAQQKEIVVKEKYDGDKFKVVPTSAACTGDKPATVKPDCNKPKPKPKTKPQPKPQPKPVEKKCECTTCPTPQPPVRVEKEVYKKNTFSLLVGYGQHGLRTTDRPDGMQVDKYNDALIGIRYTRRLNEEWDISGEAISNETGMFGLGYSF